MDITKIRTIHGLEELGNLSLAFGRCPCDYTGLALNIRSFQIVWPAELDGDMGQVSEIFKWHFLED